MFINALEKVSASITNIIRITQITFDFVNNKPLHILQEIHPDIFAEECDNLRGIFLKLKYPEKLINSTITRFIESRNQQQVRESRCSKKCTRPDYSAIQGSKISRHCT